MKRRLAFALTILTLLSIMPNASGDSAAGTGTLQTSPYRSVFKAGNGYHYVFYIDYYNKLAYSYSATGYSWTAVQIDTGSDTPSSFNLHYDGSSTVVIAYTTGSGTSMGLRTVTCTVAVPLSCSSPVTITNNKAHVGSIAITYHPVEGRWLLAYRYYEDPSYRLFFWASTSPSSSWQPLTGDIIGGVNGYTGYAPGIDAAPLTDTSNRFLVVVSWYTSASGLNVYYCRSSYNDAFCSQTWPSLGTVEGLYATVSAARSSVGVEVVVRGRWWTITDSQVVDQPDPSVGTDGVMVAATGSSVYFYWASGASIMKRTGTSSTGGGSLGSTINYMTLSQNVQISLEKNPASTASRILGYKQGSLGVYWKQDPETLSIDISEEATLSDVVRRAFLRAFAEPVAASDSMIRGFHRLVEDYLTAGDAVGRTPNKVMHIADALVIDELLAGKGSYNLLIQAVLQAVDSIAATLNPAPPEGGGGGAGGGGMVPPPVQPEPPPPPDIPAPQVALGSVVGAVIMFGVLAFSLVRGRAKPVAMWRRKTRRKKMAKTAWRFRSPFR
ncbi:MAG: hypothetical protein QXW52_08790 [Candidatus Caldarchaeum sp.]